MEDHLRQLARRDAQAIKGGIVVASAGLVAGILSLFTAAVVGVVAAALGLFALLNAVAAWLSGPRMMAERRLVLAPGVVGGVAFALGIGSAFGSGAAFAAALPAAVLVTLLLGMTLAGRRA
jgi:hypothetical protein